MTTFHDPPPQSRRAARQSERERASEEQPTAEGFTTFPSQEAQEGLVEETHTDPSTEATSAEAMGAAGESDELPSAPSAPPEMHELNSPERTMTRRELRARQQAELAGETPDATDAPEQAEEPALNQVALTVDPNIPAYIEPPALIDPLSVVPEAAAVSAPPEDALSAFESLLANADGSAKDSGITDAPRSPLVEPPREMGSAESAADLNFGGSLIAAPSEQSAATAAAQTSDSRDDSQSVTAPRSSARSTIAGLLGFGAGTPAKPAVDEPAADEPAPTVAAAQTNLSNARAEFDEQARKRLDGELPAADSTPVAPKATPSPAITIDTSGVKLVQEGRWSRQAAVEDEPNDSVASRTISSGTSATSALVLPAIPFATDIRGPLNSSGEAMLTGSIDLPSTLSASGVSDRFDHADIDSLLDLNDSDMVSTDSAPVRAIKAVSTFSNQSVTQTQKPKGTRALTVLLISASSMAVVVAGLLVAAFAFNML